MLRKGALESGLGEILLTVLVAAVISGALFGPLGSQIGEGFQEAEQFTDITTEITVSNSETLGEAAQYSFWRAWGCDKVQGESFPGLKSTNLTEDGQMPCAGAGGTIAAGAQNLWTNTGNDMEGKYSRINFVVNETIILETGNAFGPDGKDAVLLGASTGDGDRTGYSDWVKGGCLGYRYVNPSWIGNWDYGPPYSFYSVFFKNGGGSDRITRHSSQDTQAMTFEDMINDGKFSNGLYCDPITGERLAGLQEEVGFTGSDASTTRGEQYLTIKLCPGDKGYVEARKGNPTNPGEATGNNLYGMIQITQMNGSTCGENFIPSVPEGATTRGNMLFVYMDADNAYPSLVNFKLFDSTEGIDVDFDQGDDLHPPASDMCRVNIEEDDPIVDDKGSYVDFREGSTLPQSGTFPTVDNDNVTDYAFTTGNLNPVPGELDGDDVYDDLTEHGMNGYVLGGDYGLLAGNPNDKMTMHGDLLCGTPDGSEYAKWIMCDPSEPIKEIEVNGDNWQCNPESGVWTKQ